ncbi:MAG TPA: ATP-binding protein, partial [Spirochaetota bacterium]|nr:ATP-binding protein [Spirochaetota bacterium]
KLLNLYRNYKKENIDIFEKLIDFIIDYDFNGESLYVDRKLKREVSEIVKTKGYLDLEKNIDEFFDIGFRGNYEDIEPFIDILKDKEILDSVYFLSVLKRSTFVIKTAGDKIHRIVFALKNYAYHDNKKEKTLVNVADGIETVLNLYYNKYKYGVEIVRKYSEVTQVSAYPELLNQVWINLLNNALQAIDYNGKIEIEIIEDEKNVKVSFKDNGSGISPDIQKNIFTPFFTTKKSGEGTGLGLDMCKKILKEIEGDINFESGPGNTVFTVFLKK